MPISPPIRVSSSSWPPFFGFRRSVTGERPRISDVLAPVAAAGLEDLADLVGLDLRRVRSGFDVALSAADRAQGHDLGAAILRRVGDGDGLLVDIETNATFVVPGADGMTVLTDVAPPLPAASAIPEGFRCSPIS
jgi:hypothetical protein